MCPRGPTSPCFDGLPEGFVPAITWFGGGFLGRALWGWSVGWTCLQCSGDDRVVLADAWPPRVDELAHLLPPYAGQRSREQRQWYRS